MYISPFTGLTFTQPLGKRIEAPSHISSNISSLRDHLTLTGLPFRPPPSVSLSEQRITEAGVSEKTKVAVEQIPGSSWVGKMPANGNREVAILIPEGADPSQPFELIYYFHGHNGQIQTSLTDKNKGMKDTIGQMAQDPTRNMIIVIPQGPPKSQHYNWFKQSLGEDMAQFQRETQAIIRQQLLPESQIGSITVKGHSAGGFTVMNALKEGTLNANRIDFLDASYGHWASQAYNHYVKDKDVQMNVVYIPDTKTQADALSLKNKSNVTLYRSSVNHSIVPRQFFAIP